MENTNPFEFFKEEMDSDEMAVKVNTIHKISIVATLMTPDAIRNTLLPYLDTLVKREDDEVVFAIAEELANIAYF
jgi:serine/threonine-protein phosphatase 2A regulatory subunit A